MAENIVMPQLGESIAEGTIVTWLKQPGDAVKKDEDICVISTDKVEAEIPAPADGTLIAIAVQEGETVDVGTVLGQVGAAGESAAAPAPTPSSVDAAATLPPTPAVQTPVAPSIEPPPAPLAPAPSAPVAGTGTPGRFVSPLVRKIAAENGISDAVLDTLPGTGNGGRVTKKDLKAFIAASSSASAAAVAPAQNAPASIPAPPPAPTPSPRASAPSTPAAPAVASSVPVQRASASMTVPASDRETIQPASTMRKVIMENMVRSRQTSAHVTTFFDVDYTNIDRIRNEYKKQFKNEEGVGLTYTVFLAAAVTQVLKRHPYINAEIRGTDIIFKKDVHLGIAVAIDKPEPGLMVPVIQHADKMNLRGLAHSIADLAERTRIRRIKPDELSGGTFTITNPGNYGAIIGTPIINQPQVAILGVGRIKKEPVVISNDGVDSIAIRNMGVLSLSFDHRLVDGATADIFMGDLKTTLETWSTLP